MGRFWGVGDDEERIPTVQEEPISDFEKIADIPDPPPTVIPTRRSKKLSEKRGGQDYQSHRLPPSLQRGRRYTSTSIKVFLNFLLIF